VKIFRTIFLALVFSVILGRAATFGAAASASTQTVSGGGVTAKVTYLNPMSGEDFRFAVVLDTHSVGLDGYDLKTLSVLRDDRGKDYLPIGAENKGSGHHREVTLIFSKIAPESKHIEIVLRDLAGVKERTFRWNLE
jgi:hypothetical protein